MSLAIRPPSSTFTLRTLAGSHSQLACTRRRVKQQASQRHHATVADLPAELPLSGVRVLELGQLIAGPFAGQLLGYISSSISTLPPLTFQPINCRHFGAEVIKVEPPKIGDPLRVWREIDLDGTSPWFRSIGRNKKSVTIDLRQEKGRKFVIPISH